MSSDQRIPRTRRRGFLGPGLGAGRTESALRATEEVLVYGGGLILLLALAAGAVILVELALPSASFGHHFLLSLLGMTTPLLVLGFVGAASAQTLRVLGWVGPAHVLSGWGLPRTDPSPGDTFLIESFPERGLEVLHYYAVLGLCLSLGTLLASVQLAYGFTAALAVGGGTALSAVLAIFFGERSAMLRRSSDAVHHVAPLVRGRAHVFRGGDSTVGLPAGVLSRASFFENLDGALAGTAASPSYTVVLVSVLAKEPGRGFEMPRDQGSVRGIANALAEVTDPADLRGYLGNGLFGVGFSGVTSGGAIPRACRLEEELLRAAHRLPGPRRRAAIGMATTKPGPESLIEFYGRAHASFQASLRQQQSGTALLLS